MIDMWFPGAERINNLKYLNYKSFRLILKKIGGGLCFEYELLKGIQKML